MLNLTETSKTSFLTTRLIWSQGEGTDLQGEGTDLQGEERPVPVSVSPSDWELVLAQRWP